MHRRLHATHRGAAPSLAPPCTCTAVPLQGDAEDRDKLRRQEVEKAAAAAREEKQDLVMTEAGDMARLVREGW